MVGARGRAGAVRGRHTAADEGAADAGRDAGPGAHRGGDAQDAAGVLAVGGRCGAARAQGLPRGRAAAHRRARLWDEAQHPPPAAGARATDGDCRRSLQRHARRQPDAPRRARWHLCQQRAGRPSGRPAGH